MATIHTKIDDDMKKAADSLFNSLGLDTATAIRMFLVKAIDDHGFPFVIQKRGPYNSFSEEYKKAIMEFGKDPDLTFVEPPDTPFTIRDDIYE